MMSKLNVYPEVRNAAVTHSILYWINRYLKETGQYLFTYIPITYKNMFSHDFMIRYYFHFFYFLAQPYHLIKNHLRDAKFEHFETLRKNVN